MCCRALSDVIVATSVACRSAPNTDHLVTHLASLVPILAHFADDPSFEYLLECTKRAVTMALDNIHCPFSLLVRRLVAHRDPISPPLCQVLFSYHKCRFPAVSSPFLCPFAKSQPPHRTVLSLLSPDLLTSASEKDSLDHLVLAPWGHLLLSADHRE